MLPLRFSVSGRALADVRTEAEKKIAPLLKAPYPNPVERMSRSLPIFLFSRKTEVIRRKSGRYCFSNQRLTDPSFAHLFRARIGRTMCLVGGDECGAKTPTSHRRRMA